MEYSKTIPFPSSAPKPRLLDQVRQAIRQASQFEPLYWPLAASVLPLRRKSSHLRSAGRSTARKTALIGTVSSAS